MQTLRSYSVNSEKHHKDKFNQDSGSQGVNVNLVLQPYDMQKMRLRVWCPGLESVYQGSRKPGFHPELHP